MMSCVTEPSSDQPLLIVADNYRLACHYATEHDLGREGRNWRYVSRIEQVRGMRGGRYATITLGSRGHATGRVAMWELSRELRRRGFEPV